jgi:hypothetical protein
MIYFRFHYMVILICLIIISPKLITAQIVINEIMSSNNSVISDEDGSFEDWIELYNTGSDTINLEGYGLSDNPQQPFKWVFPSYPVAPDEYVLIWASGKNRKPIKNQEINGLYREVFLNIQGTSVDDLLNHPRFPNSPSGTGILNNFFESPRDVGDSYGQRVYAWMEVPISGSYTFWVSGDDNTRLYLSSDESIDNISLIAEVPGYTGPREWGKFPQQRSEPIFLEAGKRYYTQVLMKEGWGADHLAVRCRIPSGQILEPMPASYFRIMGGNLHTNFSISANGENIVLTAPDGSKIDEVPATPLFTNISLGRAPNGTGAFVLFDKATPDAKNADTGFLGRASKPEIQTSAGVYINSVEVTINKADQNDVIYYTTDGSIPDAINGILYNGPFTVNSTRTIRAVASQPSLINSEINAATFNITNASLELFSSNLPLMIINQFDIIIGSDEKREAYMTLIDNTFDNRYLLTEKRNLNSRMVIDIRGSSSQSFPKKGYGFHMYNEDDTNRKEELLGMPAEHNWILHGPFSDKSLMRNALAYELAREMGNYAPRTRFIEVFLHSGNGPLLPQHYLGVYLLVERIKIAPGRLELEELEPHHTQEPEISGGYIFKKDRLNPGETGFLTTRGNHYVYVRPQEDRINIEQREYLRTYLNQVDVSIMGPNFKDPDIGYTAFVEPLSFIDYHLMTELTKQIDGYRLSTFFHKERNGKLKLGPIWDYNLSWGNADYLDGWKTEGWYYSLISQYDYLNGWFNRMFQDEKFAKQYRRRYTNLRKSVFSNENIIQKLRTNQAILQEGAQRNFQRWQVMGQYVWPNWFIAQSYNEEIDWMQQWIEKRLIWMDSQLLDSTDLLHYWNFNASTTYLDPSFTIGGAGLSIELGPDSEELTGTGQNFMAENARFGDQAESHLRVNNPIGTEIVFDLPTRNYKDIYYAYETRRSGSGANRQYLSYSIDGENFITIDTIIVTETPTVITYDFKNLTDVNHNLMFKIKINIDHEDDGTGGTVGNNRFDNVTLEGVPIENSNFPPIVIGNVELIELIALDEEFQMDFSAIFEDPEGDPLIFDAELNQTGLAILMIEHDQLKIEGLNQGETILNLIATDGINPPVQYSIRLLVYPTAADITESNYVFEYWDAEQAEGAYPDHMLLMQSAKNDPELEDELLYAYHIPHDDYAPADMGNIGFPYKNESRTRINGLNDEGLSFINTGRGRDLGAALVNINTSGVDSVFVSWLGETRRPNSRIYHMRMQYKVGLNGTWQDILNENSEPIEYVRSTEEGHMEYFDQIVLPVEVVGHSNVFIRWKYYYTGIQLDMNSGARDMIRLDDIIITKERSSSIGSDGIHSTLKVYPNPLRKGILYFNEPVIGHITDLRGTRIKQLEGVDQTDLSATEPGMYILITNKGEVLKIVLY